MDAQEATKKYKMALSQLNEAQEANKELTIKLSCAESKASQLEACLKQDEATVAKLKERSNCLLLNLISEKKRRQALKFNSKKRKKKKQYLETHC